MVKKLSCVSYGSLKRFPHTFTSTNRSIEGTSESASKGSTTRDLTFEWCGFSSILNFVLREG